MEWIQTSLGHSLELQTSQMILFLKMLKISFRSTLLCSLSEGFVFTNRNRLARKVGWSSELHFCVMADATAIELEGVEL